MYPAARLAKGGISYDSTNFKKASLYIVLLSISKKVRASFTLFVCHPCPPPLSNLVGMGDILNMSKSILYSALRFG